MISLPSSSVVNGTMVSSTSWPNSQLGRIVLGEPALDADHVVELHQADAERDEVLTGGPLYGAPGGKPWVVH